MGLETVPSFYKLLKDSNPKARYRMIEASECYLDTHLSTRSRSINAELVTS
ncbi:hypothetical protein [Methanobacterium spitsbergense]|uniref:Uncharacterized protein n=1 Tax=Methanobacterium spitsbergense TaxID=2874285 RepID=A0A8T5UUM7_9EURY|nr:hypothetical protein [Methanobacterium spitsbergense]MBZ2164563.1 hypothetical protein [Methanobacterium spitsbergense]